MTDDAELLRRYAEEKSEEAFAELVRRHIDFVYAAALRQARGNASLAQDVMPGTAHIREFPCSVFPIAGIDGCNPMSPDDVFIDRRTEDGRQSTDPELLRRYVEGRAFGEIGANLRLTEDAARMRVERALDKLHALLAKRGVTSTASALAAVLANQAAATVPSGLFATITGAALTQAAGTSATGGAATTILNIMSTTKIPLTIVGAIGVILVGVAVVRLPEDRAATPEQFQMMAQSPNRPATLIPAASASPRAGDLLMTPKSKKTLRGGD